MKRIIFSTILMFTLIMGIAYAAAQNPYTNGTYETTDPSIGKVLLYGITVDGTLYPVKVDTDGSLYTL